MCRFGKTNGAGYLIRKSTTFIASHEIFEDELGLRCSPQHRRDVKHVSVHGRTPRHRASTAKGSPTQSSG
eukprot:10229254-Alexandrium_andersonii.AAC.1